MGGAAVFSRFHKQSVLEFSMAEFLIMMYGCRKEPRNLICFHGAACTTVITLGFGATLIPSWLFCNNSAEEEGRLVGEAPFYSSNPPSPPMEYNPLSPDLQIMQRCSHFNWPGRH